MSEAEANWPPALFGGGAAILLAMLPALAWPDAPQLALWHAVTLLREHRGDGHISALTAAGIDP